MSMDVSEDAVRDVCTDAVFERGENYLAEERIHGIHRVDTAVTAVVHGSRQYDVRVDLTVDGFGPDCSCPYDGPGACKHVVAVLLQCVDDIPEDESDRIESTLDDADPEQLRGFLREVLAADTALRDRFLARFDEAPTRSLEEYRADIDRRFEETNPDYYVVFEPIDFSEWFDLAATSREQEQYASATTVYRALVESLDNNMDRVDGAYDHFSQAFTRALDGYVDCVTAAAGDPDEVADAVAFLDERAASGTPFLSEHFERAAAELQA